MSADGTAGRDLSEETWQALQEAYRAVERAREALRICEVEVGRLTMLRYGETLRYPDRRGGDE